MTMAIEIKNGDPHRVAEVREEEWDLTQGSGPQAARQHKSRLGPGESRTFYIHAAKTLTVVEDPNG